MVGRSRDDGRELRQRQGFHHLDRFFGVRVDYGMAGPNFVTASGGKECLLEAAKNSAFYDVVDKVVLSSMIVNRPKGRGRGPTKPPKKRAEDFS